MKAPWYRRIMPWEQAKIDKAAEQTNQVFRQLLSKDPLIQATMWQLMKDQLLSEDEAFERAVEVVYG